MVLLAPYSGPAWATDPTGGRRREEEVCVRRIAALECVEARHEDVGLMDKQPSTEWLETQHSTVSIEFSSTRDETAALESRRKV